MLLSKIVLSFFATTVGALIAPHACASPFQDTNQTPSNQRNTLPLEHRLKLDFENATFLEFVGVSPKQSELLCVIAAEIVSVFNEMLDFKC